MIKLRIGDDDLEQELDRYQSGHVTGRTVRGTIESAGIEAPAVTVEELRAVIRDASMQADWYNEAAANAVLELMRRRTVPAAPGSQWVDLARVTDEELSRDPVVLSIGTRMIAEDDGAAIRAWLIEKCGGAR